MHSIKYTRYLLLLSSLLFSLNCFGSEHFAKLGAKTPDFNLQTQDGQTFSLKDFNGTTLVIHFGASWCPFCRAEEPHLEALYNNYKDKNVKVLVIDVFEEKEVAAKWLKRSGYTMPMLLDLDGKVATSYMPPDELPDLARHEAMVASNLVIDKNGILRFFSLVDTRAFDAKLTNLKKKLDEIINEK